MEDIKALKGKQSNKSHFLVIVAPKEGQNPRPRAELGHHTTHTQVCFSHAERIAVHKTPGTQQAIQVAIQQHSQAVALQEATTGSAFKTSSDATPTKHIPYCTWKVGNLGNACTSPFNWPCQENMGASKELGVNHHRPMGTANDLKLPIGAYEEPNTAIHSTFQSERKGK